MLAERRVARELRQDLLYDAAPGGAELGLLPRQVDLGHPALSDEVEQRVATEETREKDVGWRTSWAADVLPLAQHHTYGALLAIATVRWALRLGPRCTFPALFARRLNRHEEGAAAGMRSEGKRSHNGPMSSPPDGRRASASSASAPPISRLGRLARLGALAPRALPIAAEVVRRAVGPAPHRGGGASRRAAGSCRARRRPPRRCSRRSAR